MYDTAVLARVLDEVAAQHDVDIIVNNAYELSSATGFNSPEGTLETASLDQWTVTSRRASSGPH